MSGRDPLQAADAPALAHDQAATLSDQASQWRTAETSGGGATPITPSERAWNELRERWADGIPLRAEALLAQEPTLAADPSLAVDLIYGEFVLAEQFGWRPALSDYVGRFPQYADALRRQLDLHIAWGMIGSEPPLAKAVAAPKASTAIECPGYIGRYYLLAPLDSGGQGQVFRAFHPDLEQEVALKVGFAPHDATQQDDRVLREGKVLAGLSHPNIARVFDLGTHDGRPFIVMELVRGPNLAQFARRETCTPLRAAEVVAKVARAVEAAHAGGVVHLDIKPKNIIVDPSGEPKLIDFGLACPQTAWDEVESERSLAGTLQYMSPEQANCDSERIGPQADVFGLGGVLFFLLTGQPPISGSDFPAALTKARTGDWNRAALSDNSAPRELQAICSAALAKDLTERVSSAKLLAEKLEAFARRPVRVFPKTIKPYVLAAAAMVVVGGLLIASRWSGPPNGATESARTGEHHTLRPVLPEDNLAVEVWEDGGPLQLHNVVPLRTGDRIRFRATVPAGVQASLFILQSDGTFREITTFPVRKAPHPVMYPADELAAVPVTGKAGTEVLLLCGRKKAPVDAAEINSAQATSPWPMLPELTVLRASSQAVQIEQAGRDVGAPEAAPSTAALIAAQLEVLRSSLAPRCDLFEALAYCHAE